MSKGISAVIATILLLLITITLATVAYVYVTNILSSKTAKAFQVLGPDCTSGVSGFGNISFVLSNQGTQAISNNDLIITVNNTLTAGDFYNASSPTFSSAFNLGPGQSVVLVRRYFSTSGQQEIRISTSSDSQVLTIPC